VADRRALEILFSRYWSPSGWRNDQVTTPADFAHAKSMRVMFDDDPIDHDTAMARLLAARDALQLTRVSDAFVSSLSTRRLDLRSAFGSYAVSRHITRHTISPLDGPCVVCQCYPRTTGDLNVLSFERQKWGGVRHDQIEYAQFDLALFAREQVHPVEKEDVQRLAALLDTFRNAPRSTTSGKVQSLLAPIVKSNKAERDVLIGMLGFAGILRTAPHPSYREAFVPVTARALPRRHFVDMAYPACWWSGDVGLNWFRLREQFGHVL